MALAAVPHFSYLDVYLEIPDFNAGDLEAIMALYAPETRFVARSGCSHDY